MIKTFLVKAPYYYDRLSYVGSLNSRESCSNCLFCIYSSATLVIIMYLFLQTFKMHKFGNTLYVLPMKMQGNNVLCVYVCYNIINMVQRKLQLMLCISKLTLDWRVVGMLGVAPSPGCGVCFHLLNLSSACCGMFPEVLRFPPPVGGTGLLLALWYLSGKVRQS